MIVKTNERTGGLLVMQIKLSKRQWEYIGKEAGWMREAATFGTPMGKAVPATYKYFYWFVDSALPNMINASNNLVAVAQKGEQDIASFNTAVDTWTKAFNALETATPDKFAQLFSNLRELDHNADTSYEFHLQNIGYVGACVNAIKKYKMDGNSDAIKNAEAIKSFANFSASLKRQQEHLKNKLMPLVKQYEAQEASKAKQPQQ